MVVMGKFHYEDKEHKRDESENIEMNKNSFWTEKEK